MFKMGDINSELPQNRVTGNLTRLIIVSQVRKIEP